MRKYALVFVIMAAVAAAVLAGCGRGGGSSSSLAEINGKKFTSDDLVKFMGSNPMGKDQVAGMLSQLLEEELILDLAADKKVSPTDEQVNQRLSLVKKAEDLDAYLKESGQTLDDYKHRLEIDQARVNLAETTLKDKIKDEDVKKEYDQLKDTNFAIPERIKMDAVIFQSKAAADDAAKKLASGDTLQKVADKAGLKVMHQSMPKKEMGLPDDLKKAIFEGKKDKPSKPISVGMEQWVIVVPGDKMPAVNITLEDAKPLIHAQLVMRNGQKDLQKMLDKAHKDAKLTISEPTLKDVEKTFKKPAASMDGGEILP